MGTDIATLAAVLVVIGVSCITYALADAGRRPPEARAKLRPAHRASDAQCIYVPSVVVHSEIDSGR